MLRHAPRPGTLDGQHPAIGLRPLAGLRGDRGHRVRVGIAAQPPVHFAGRLLVAALLVPRATASRAGTVPEKRTGVGDPVVAERPGEDGPAHEPDDPLPLLGGNPNPDPVPAIAVQASQWAQTDRRVVAVERAWARCMAQHGYSYHTPQQAQQHNWPRVPSTGEVATAVADVSCKVRTDLPNTWLTVEAAYQSALIGQNLTALSQLQANFGNLLRRAEALLGSGP